MMGLTLENWRDIAAIIGTAVAAVALWKAVIEYTLQNKQKRAEWYIRLGEKFVENGRFDGLFEMLIRDDPALASVPFHKKQELLGFYEDIALLVNTGLLRREIAHYMFAYYAILCWKSINFWANVNRESAYWSLFKHFVEEMMRIEKTVANNTDGVPKLRL
jgi:hypothetical protein